MKEKGYATVSDCQRQIIFFVCVCHYVREKGYLCINMYAVVAKIFITKGKIICIGMYIRTNCFYFI